MIPKGRAAFLVLLPLGVLVGAAAFGPAFDSYDSDLWTYLLVAERVAAGQDMLRLEPFHLEPPASPHVSAVWLLLGLLRRATGLPLLVLARGLGLVAVAALGFAAYRLASAFLEGQGGRCLAVGLFFLAVPEPWAALVLGRYLGLAFVFLAAAGATRLGHERGAIPWTAVHVALAFYVHFFGGVLALGAVALVALARWRRADAAWRPTLAALAAGLGLALPCLAYAATVAGRARTSAHVWRPEQVEAFGLTLMSPADALRLVPPAMLALALVGLFAPVSDARAALGRDVARMGTVLSLLVLLTPLYHLSVQAFGAWMAGRVVALAFPWIAATLGLAWLLARDRTTSLRLAGLALAAWAVGHSAAQAAEDWRHERYAFSPESQAEAASLRPTLAPATYLAPDLIGYGIATPTLGRPLAVPPGHASPFGDFRRRQRRVHRAFLMNSEECWTTLLALYPEARYLVTPAPEAVAERAIWSERFPEVTPEEVRARLSALGALRPVHAGKRFVVDELAAPAGAGPAEGRRGMGVGSRCREDP